MMRNILGHNEERMEMSLSQLAFSLLGDSNRGDVDKLNTNYVLLNYSRTLVKDMMRDLSLVPDAGKALSTAHRLVEVNTITMHMRATITAMHTNSWQTYVSGQLKYQRGDPRTVCYFIRPLRRYVSQNIKSELENTAHILLRDNDCYNEQLREQHGIFGPQIGTLTTDELRAIQREQAHAEPRQQGPILTNDPLLAPYSADKYVNILFQYCPCL